MFAGPAVFKVVKIHGGGGFGRTKFEGEATFVGAKFNGNAWFGGAMFGGVARFNQARFGGMTKFDEAEFDCEVTAKGVNFVTGVPKELASLLPRDASQRADPKPTSTGDDGSVAGSPV